MRQRARCVAVVLASAGAAGACVDNGDPDWGEADFACEMAQISDGQREEIVARMFALGVPAELTWVRDGQQVGRWTFGYDGERRLMAEERDLFGGANGGPDGVPEMRRELTHTADEVVESFVDLQSMSSVPVETIRLRLDGFGWVRETVTRDGRGDFVVSSDGWLERAAMNADDPETGETFTSMAVFERTNEDLLQRTTSTDTRVGSATVAEYEHELAGAAHRVRMIGANAPPMVFDYLRDAEGRLVRAAVDEDGDGGEDWTVDIAYAADRSVTVTSARAGQVFRTHTYSSGCRKTIEEPWAPRGEPRPGPRWMLIDPSIPTPF